MSFLQVGSEQIRLNGEGHLASYDDWTEDVARAMAERDQIVLEKCHWIAIHFMREFYNEYETAPSPRRIVKSVGDQLDSRGCNTRKLKEIFPLGGCKHACRLAGLPTAYCHAC